jgi:hypothetical protein
MIASSAKTNRTTMDDGGKKVVEDFSFYKKLVFFCIRGDTRKESLL